MRLYLIRTVSCRFDFVGITQVASVKCRAEPEFLTDTQTDGRKTDTEKNRDKQRDRKILWQIWTTTDRQTDRKGINRQDQREIRTRTDRRR